MKTVVLIFIVLAVTTITYGSEKEVQRFKNIYAKCAEDLGELLEARLDVALCSAYEYGGVIYSNGDYNKYAIMANIKDFISDPTELEQALKIYIKCDEEASGVAGISKTLKMIKCSLPILSLLN